MLRKITIQKRLITAFGLLALLLAITGILGLQSLSKVRAQADIVETKLLPAVSDLGQLEILATRSRAVTLRLLLAIDITQEGAAFEKIKAINEEAHKANKAFAATIDTPQVRNVYQQFNTVLDQYFTLQQQTLEFLHKEELGAAQDLLDKMNPVADQLTAYMNQLSDLNQKAADEARAESIATYNSAKWAVIALIIVAVIIALVIAILISQSVNRPLSRAVISARFIADGDLTQAIVVDGNDELMELSSALEQMQQKLRDAISHISSSSSQLASAAEELNVVTDESAKALQLQNDEVQQAATAITEMSSAVDEVAGTEIGRASCRERV